MIRELIGPAGLWIAVAMIALWLLWPMLRPFAKRWQLRRTLRSYGLGQTARDAGTPERRRLLERLQRS